ncbi:MAG: Dabb family protein [Oscillospiraceae bacterium]|nr:Dabb family protein [Oscillospiraceae bacterium]
MIKHIVMWKLHKDGTDDQRRETIAAFREKTDHLKQIIPEIVEARIGENLNDGDVFHVCIDSVFESMESLSRYINHPEHLKVREFMTAASYDKAVFDYEI